MTLEVAGDAKRRRAGVLGHPISHSLSPALHRAAYAALGLDWRYDAFDVDEAGLADFMKQLSGDWAGLSLTMPLKRAVIPLLDHVEPLAALTGSVNTVLFSGDGSGRIRVGANTDIYGIAAAIRSSPGWRGEMRRGAVIGAGATAASALAALGELGCDDPVVFVRSRGRAGQVMRAAERMGLSVTWAPFEQAAESAGFDVVISTVPAGAADSVAANLDPGAGILLDVVYSPWPTVLASAWPGTVISGKAMLLHQACEQVRLMTNLPAPIQAMASVLGVDGP